MIEPLPYDLCLKLKEAGWPQPEVVGDGEWVTESGIFDGKSPEAYSPSLEELIEACPLRINGKPATIALYITEDGCGGSVETEESIPIGREVRTVADFEGETPKEAVAHLWLKLKEGNAK